MRSPVTWVIILGIAVAGGAYLLYRRSKSAASSTGTTGTTGTSTGDQTDYSGQIATLQTEIEDLQSSSAQDSSDSTGTGTSSSGSGTGTGTSGTGTGTGSSGTGSSTPAKTTAKAPAMPTSVVGAASGPASAKVSWGKVSGATSYQVRFTYQGKLAGSATTSGTSATVSGLTPDHTYTAHVKACNAAGCSSETNGPVIKTPKAA